MDKTIGCGLSDNSNCKSNFFQNKLYYKYIFSHSVMKKKYVTRPHKQMQVQIFMSEKALFKILLLLIFFQGLLLHDFDAEEHLVCAPIVKVPTWGPKRNKV